MVLLFTRGGGAAGEEEEEEEVVDDDDDEEEEENATVRTDVLLLPRQEGDVLEDVDADVVVDAYEVDALLTAQTNARLLVHARILCCVVMHGRLSSFVSVVGLMKNLYFFTNRKRRDKSASSHSLAEIKIERNKKSAKRNTHTHKHVFSFRILLRWNFRFGFVQRYARCVRRKRRSRVLFRARRFLFFVLVA